MRDEPKYKTLQELVGTGHAVMIDNDEVCVYDSETEEFLFSMHPRELLEQALELLGIEMETL